MDAVIIRSLDKFAVDVDLKEKYLTYVLERGDLPVKAQYVKNPALYRPIRWALNGKPEPESKLETKDAESEAPQVVSSDNTLVTPTKSNNPLLASPSTSASGTNDGDAAACNPPPAKKSRREDRRGQNKDRNANVKSVTIISEKQICHTLAGSNTCSFGEACKNNHDLKTAVAEKNQNLLSLPPVPVDDKSREHLYVSGEITALSHQYSHLTDHGITLEAKLCDGDDTLVKCPYSEQLFCPYGINCMMGNHVNEEGQNLTRDGEVVTEGMYKTTKFPSSIVGLNETSSAFKSSLKSKKRQREGAYPLSEHFLSNYKKETQFEGYSPETPVTEKYVSEWAKLQDEMKEIRTNIGFKERGNPTGDFLKGKLVLAPLTTVGNLPFRRLCVSLGADVTVGEMALARSLIEGNRGEHALLKRHPDEKLFGIQLAGGYPDEMIKVAEMLEAGEEGTDGYSFDFVDINMGCPLEQLHKRFGGGSVLMTRKHPQEIMLRGMTSILSRPVTCKFRNDHFQKNGKEAHKLAPRLERWGAGALIHHGRTAKARYTGLADWNYIHEVMNGISVPVIGNGDVFSPFDVVANRKKAIVEEYHGGMMIGRGALIKPWIFEEIKQNKVWDISSSQRFDYLRRFCSYGLEHWGSDKKGVETTRRFLLEAQSFLHRYTPVGLLERVPAGIQGRPPPIQGRDELETLMASPCATDWIKISEMLLGKCPAEMEFVPKHKSSSYPAEE